MTAPIPPIRPYLVVSDAAAAVEFYKNAFSAVQDGEAHVMPGTGKIMHVRLLINGGLIMLCDDFSQMMGGGCMTAIGQSKALTPTSTIPVVSSTFPIDQAS